MSWGGGLSILAGAEILERRARRSFDAYESVGKKTITNFLDVVSLTKKKLLTFDISGDLKRQEVMKFFI